MKDITNRISWLLILIELVSFFALIFVASETMLYLKSRFYDKYSFILNVIFYASPIIAFLLSKDTDKEVFQVGTYFLFLYILFIDCMYLVQLFQNNEELGFLQWLYILPASFITYINYYIIRHVNLHKYCPSCRTKIKLKEQSFCHNCGTDLLHYNEVEKTI